MKSEVDEIALQGVEFWSTVCDEEVDLAIELSEVWNSVPQCIEKCSGYSIFSKWADPCSSILRCAPKFQKRCVSIASQKCEL